MGSDLMHWEDDDDDDPDGLPDAAFTEDELAAGVQHIVRTGNPNATSSGRNRVPWSLESVESGIEAILVDADDALPSRSAASFCFESFAQARAWAQSNPGGVLTRAADGSGFEGKFARRDQSVNPEQRKFSSAAANMPSGRDFKASEKKPYRIDNPAVATWVQGTYPTTEDEEELFDVDMENKRRIFWPSLKKLAPYFASQARRGTFSMMVLSSSFLQQQSRSDLFKLLALLEEQVERSIRWYTTQRDHADLHRTRQDAAVNIKPHTPKETVFWQNAVAAVMDELISRE